MTQSDMASVFKAADFAASHHAGQFRLGGQVPYINHPLNVCKILADEGGVEAPSILSSALLHDILEDTDVTEEFLAKVFGQEICSIVVELTNDLSLSKLGRKEEQIRRAATYSQSAAIVRAGDQISNLRSVISSPPPNWSPGRCSAYIQWMKRVASAMTSLPEPLRSLHAQALQDAEAMFGSDSKGFSYENIQD